MAILKSIVNVNNGNTGWTSSNVMDALETVFSNLGWHGGSSTVTGVPCGLISPNNEVSTNDDDWRRAGGPAVYTNYKTYYYDVVANGTTTYRWLKRYTLGNWSHVYSETNSSRPSQIYIQNHEFVQNQAIHWAPNETDESKNINGLTLDTVYYVIVVDSDHIKLATNATNSANGTNIDFPYGGYYSTDYAAKSNIISYFRPENTSAYDNTTLTIDMGDVLNINLSSTGAGNFHFCYDTDNYDAGNHVSTSTPETNNASNPTGTGSDSGNVIWDTFGYQQTYTAVTQPTFHPTETYQEPGRKYIYANDTNPSMKGVIIVNPRVSNRSYTTTSPFWDYEVPQSGNRSALKIRVWRHQENSSSYRGKIRGMKILNQGSGWTAGETFTIPGDQIGGATPANDITFGTRVAGDNNGTGTPGINVTTLGGGSSFFQKADNGQWAVLKNINDASKTYGTTYYTFGIDTYSNNKLIFNCGNGWRWLNLQGTRESEGNANGGVYTGKNGLDRGNSYYYALTTSNSGYWSTSSVNYCTNSTPTSYPLEIRVYRAQSPQDTNFAIIQFCQTINGDVLTFGTFSIYKGSQVGSNIWDLDDVFVGSILKYDTITRGIRLKHNMPLPRYGYYSTSYSPTEEPIDQYSLAREAFFGYMRNPGGGTEILSNYKSNIKTEANSQLDTYLYYRNSTYDQYNGNFVSSGANYYRPFKGIPINERMVPCPYYLPDDFVMLQVSTSPGLTEFRTGDTVTIGGNENYEIIMASYENQQNGLDGINNNSTIGMLFLARIN